MSFRCPSCDRPLYNRRRVTCEFCGATIPQTLLLNQAQIDAIERLKSVEAKDHRDFMTQPALNGAHAGGNYF